MQEFGSHSQSKNIFSSIITTFFGCGILHCPFFLSNRLIACSISWLSILTADLRSHHHVEENGDRHGEETHASKETEFLLRIGMGYVFEMEEFAITPTIALDFVRGHRSFVWGLSIGKGF